ncbi:hypothetical protein AVEN_33493-1 [Araneus ventricosus]|uniref:Uncharacterized protein n=1 Tax=Araneus ventricosus TaxID=182803 RepID=A0A4Y2T521_ARAVE|nr:hypothetical protein AVEN_38896-1 [Araneus ventricosus]GBN94499.1 hypothetical protein AVEN_33493-1 [Araneus ventricosus]
MIFDDEDLELCSVYSEFQYKEAELVAHLLKRNHQHIPHSIKEMQPYTNTLFYLKMFKFALQRKLARPIRLMETAEPTARQWCQRGKTTICIQKFKLLNHLRNKWIMRRKFVSCR